MEKEKKLSKILKYFQNKFDLLNSAYLQTVKKNKLPAIFQKKYSLFTIVIILFVFIYFTFFNSSKIDSNIPLYKIKRDTFRISVTESGEIKAKNSISIAAPRVRSSLKIVFLVPEGTYIKSGDIVAKFDPTEALTKLKEAEAQLEIAMSNKEKLMANQASEIAQMESQLKSSQLSFELSKLSMEQMKFEAQAKQREAALQHQKNELQYEQTQKDYESKKIIQQSEMNNMNVEVRQKKNDLEKAKMDLDDLTLSASAEGLVVYGVNWANNGQKFQIGDQPWPGQVIITLPDLSAMESETYVNEVDVSKVSMGQKVIVKLDAFQDSTFTGKITSIARLGKNKNYDSDIKVFDVHVDIEGVSEILKPGMTTSNQIIVNETKDKLFVPHEAVFNESNEFFVYKKNGSGFDKVNVKIGSKSEDFIVINDGLQNGDFVALRNPTLEIHEEISGDSPTEVETTKSQTKSKSARTIIIE
ncbi:MAG: HlyD family efflux transporter periplasmic adaptor subunit [Ignavibacteriales bacterium]|nr:HlyD family efflux transporter periplasmic adaptor subunit [Ignavibacteriales bacterium]